MRKLVVLTILLAVVSVGFTVAAATLKFKAPYDGRKEQLIAQQKEDKDNTGGGEAANMSPEERLLSSISGYWEGVKRGDWVKYVSRYNGEPVIEIWTVEDINVEDAEIEMVRAYYDNEGTIIKHEEFAIDLKAAEEAYITFQAGKKEADKVKKVEEIEATFNGKEIPADVKVGVHIDLTTDKWGRLKDVDISNCTIDAFSKDVKAGGKVYNENLFQWQYYYLADGTDSEKDLDRKEVKPGDVQKALEVVESIPKSIKVAARDKYELEREKWLGAMKKEAAADAVPDIEDKLEPAPEEIQAELDKLEGYYKGIRVGDWCKLIIRGHHIQVWTVYDIEREGADDIKVKWRRRFYNNLGNMYLIDNASGLVSDSEKMYQQYKTDPSFAVDKEIDEVGLPGGKSVPVRLLIRRASMGSMCRMLSRENPLEGHVLSMFNGEIFYVLTDWGRKADSDRKAVKKGDVEKALEELHKWMDKELSKHIDSGDL